MPPTTVPGTAETEDLEALKTEFGSTHSVWRSKVGGQAVGSWYATLRRDPRPEEAGLVFPTISGDTHQDLREFLSKQVEIIRQLAEQA
ncbi:hypothetical protein [Actinocorallia aurantiaca]|uniref:Uncharacterized protein n=1 Tax=Actinocorallia aurantiaca TaxID=46204 RepID=A0ABN3UFV9_9ACTN